MKIRKSRAPVTYGVKEEVITLVGGGVNDCAYSCNFRTVENGLQIGYKTITPTGYGVCPSSISSTYCSKYNLYEYLVAGNGVYSRRITVANNYTFSSLYSGRVALPSIVDCMYEGEMSTVIFTGLIRLICNGNTLTTLSTDKAFYSCVMHGGRVFAVDVNDRNKLYWSASGAFDWTEGIHGSGGLTLAGGGGTVVKLISFGDKLIAMRYFGITVIRAYGDAQFFKVESTHTYLTTNRIIPETCAVWGGKIWFCTETGIYSFDGSSITKAVLPGGETLSSVVSAAAFDGTYFVACTHGVLGNAVYAYETADGKGFYLALPTNAFLVSTKIFSVGASVIKSIEKSEEGTGVWQSKKIVFGGSRPRFVREVIADGDGQVAVTVTTDKGEQTFDGGRCRIMAPLSSLSVKVEADCAIRSVKIITEASDGI